MYSVSRSSKITGFLKALDCHQHHGLVANSKQATAAASMWIYTLYD
jgi:hypothetical protein